MNPFQPRIFDPAEKTAPELKQLDKPVPLQAATSRISNSRLEDDATQLFKLRKSIGRFKKEADLLASRLKDWMMQDDHLDAEGNYQVQLGKMHIRIVMSHRESLSQDAEEVIRKECGQDVAESCVTRTVTKDAVMAAYYAGKIKDKTLKRIVQIGKVPMLYVSNKPFSKDKTDEDE